MPGRTSGSAITGPLEFLNSHDDPSFLRTALASEVSRAYIPTPKVNFVEVVINGESWGIYVNAQPFNKDFIRDSFKTTKVPDGRFPAAQEAEAASLTWVMT